MSQSDQLLLIDEHPSPAKLRDSDRVKAAIVADGKANGGKVDPNRVRDALADLPILEQPMHKHVGAAWSAFITSGFIVRDGVTESDDKPGRNAGRLIRTYKLTDRGWHWQPTTNESKAS